MQRTSQVLSLSVADGPICNLSLTSSAHIISCREICLLFGISLWCAGVLSEVILAAEGSWGLVEVAESSESRDLIVEAEVEVE